MKQLWQGVRLAAQLTPLTLEVQRLVQPEEMPLRIEKCQQALALLDPTIDHLLIAQWRRELGNSLIQNPFGDRTALVDQALAEYQTALALYPRDRYPVEWARTLANIGRAYWVRPHGIRAENIEHALDYLRPVLPILTREADPEVWATVQIHLGAVYQYRVNGDPVTNQEQAIAHYQQALEIYTSADISAEWAMIHNNLGSLYTERIHGERAENSEQAIRHLQYASEFFQAPAYRDQLAGVASNLCEAYFYRLRGNRAENLNQALQWGSYGLRLIDQTRTATTWAQLHLSIAHVYQRRQAEGDLQLAVEHYRQAATIYTYAQYPDEWAQVQHSLGVLYGYRITTDPVQFFDRALHHYQEALKVYTQQANPDRWAVIQRCLAEIHVDRHTATETGDTVSAVAYLTAALTVLTPQRNPWQCRETAFELGRLLYAQRRYGDALITLEIAHEAVEAMRRETRQISAKQRMATDNAQLYAMLVAACLYEGNGAAAFRFATANKGRIFTETLDTAHVDLDAQARRDPVFAAELQRLRTLQQELDDVRDQLFNPARPRVRQAHDEDIDARLQQLRSEEIARWDDLAYRYPSLTALTYVPTLSGPAACALAARLNAPLVEYYRHADGWCAFVVTAEQLTPVALPPETDAMIELAAPWLEAAGNAWHYSRFGDNDEAPKQAGERTTETVLTQIYATLIAPIAPYLPSQGRIIIAPFGMLHWLPINAALNPHTHEYVADRYTASFSPSLSALSMMVLRHTPSTQVQPTRLLNVAYPGAQGSPSYLPYVLDEAASIAQCFSGHVMTPLYNEQATADAFVRHAADHTIIHVGCHGWFDVGEPRQSGLFLAEGWLTVQRILTEIHFDATQLVTLGACFGAHSDAASGDENIGLAHAFMMAGAPVVVAGLWRVGDASTKAFFTAFYAHLTHGQSVTAALYAAIMHLRTQTQWDHPAYWAAFQVYGLEIEGIGPATP